jgi:hypothetical protein
VETGEEETTVYAIEQRARVRQYTDESVVAQGPDRYDEGRIHWE